MSRPCRSGKVLVLGDDIRSFLAVVRSLGRSGLEVDVAWHPVDSLILKSRFVHRAHQLPPYDEADRTWKARFIDLVERERFDLVIPCNDPAAIPLQKHRSELEPFGRIYLLEDSVWKTVSDKLAMNERARAAGVKLPRECVVAQPSEANDVPATFHLPVVLKPRSSFDLDSVGSRQKVQKAYSWEDFSHILEGMCRSGPVAIQENFIGQGVGVELLLDDGEILLEFQHVRLHEPLRGGGSYYRKAVPVTPALREAALALLRPLRYTATSPWSRFKVHPETGDWIFIEVNGRFWGSLPLAVAAGVPFPLALYELLVEGRKSFPQGYRSGLCCRYLSGDVMWQMANLRANRADPTLATSPLKTVVGETLVNVLTLRERSDTLTWDDPWPGVVEAFRLISGLAGSQRRKLRNRWLMRPAVQNRLRRRARAALESARTILFVCKGNICRSPFAEHLARHLLRPDQIVLSAGYYPAAGRASPEAAVAAAAEFGVDLSGHRSVRLTDDLVQRADAIVGFDAENLDRLIADYRCGRKVHLLGPLCADGDCWIEDPYDKDVDVFRHVYGRINTALLGAAAVTPAAQMA